MVRVARVAIGNPQRRTLKSTIHVILAEHALAMDEFLFPNSLANLGNYFLTIQQEK